MQEFHKFIPAMRPIRGVDHFGNSNHNADRDFIANADPHLNPHGIANCHTIALSHFNSDLSPHGYPDGNYNPNELPDLDPIPHGFSNNLYHTIFIANPNALPRNAACYTNPHAVHSPDCDTTPFYNEEGVSSCGVQS